MPFFFAILAPGRARFSRQQFDPFPVLRSTLQRFCGWGAGQEEEKEEGGGEKEGGGGKEGEKDKKKAMCEECEAVERRARKRAEVRESSEFARARSSVVATASLGAGATLAVRLPLGIGLGF